MPGGEVAMAAPPTEGQMMFSKRDCNDESMGVGQSQNSNSGRGRSILDQLSQQHLREQAEQEEEEDEEEEDEEVEGGGGEAGAESVGDVNDDDDLSYGSEGDEPAGLRELEENVSLFGTGRSGRRISEDGHQSSRRSTGASSHSLKSPAPAPTCVEKHNVRVIGEGPELLFLSHGFGTNQLIWGGVLDRLDLVNSYRVILWDLTGAYSADPDGFDFQQYSTLHAYADDLLELLDELEIEQITYIGHSVSGMLGLIASRERPSFFKRLILIGASPRYLDSPGYHGGFSLEQLDQVFAAMQDNYKVWASGFAPLVVGEDVESPAVREFCRTLFLVRPDIAFSTLKTIFMCDCREVLPQVTNQIHLLNTKKDAAVPWDPVHCMVNTIPNVFIEILPVEGHLPHLTHPNIMTEAVLRHLAMPLREVPAQTRAEPIWVYGEELAAEQT